MKTTPLSRIARRLTVLSLLASLLIGGPVLAAGDGGKVAHIRFDTIAVLTKLAARLDIWEVHYDAGQRQAGYVVAWITPQEAAWLASEGFHIEAAVQTATTPETIPAYPCYRTIDEVVAQLAAWATQYPSLTELSTLGHSYESRPLQVLRLTNEATGVDKPVFFLMANIHGRELITPEVALGFIEGLLTGYGVDPDLTWLLDHERIEVLVSANPDGHVRNEAGQPWAYWRKNANPTYGWCSGTAFGIDLNRNSGYHWGGAGLNPCEETYQGPSAVSETETQAVQAFIAGLFPDQRPADETTPAPLDTSGLFITLHSYGNLVLWPWGYTTAPAPNADQLAALGRKLAIYNGYLPQQAVGLYPTTGSTDDWAYGELGIASYTFEIGSSSDGFYPPCSRYDALVQPNVAALLYAAKVARAPYRLPAGPDARDVAVTVDGSAGLQTITVTAQIDDRDNGGNAIAAAEAYLDVPPWAGGTPVPLAPQDGAFDGPLEAVVGTLTVSSSLTRTTLLYVRGRDTTGAWGPVTAGFAEPMHALGASVYLPAVLLDATPVPGAAGARVSTVVRLALASGTPVRGAYGR